MIGDLISKIQDAEIRAAKIIADAEKKAMEMDAATEVEIEKIQNGAHESIAKIKRPTPPRGQSSPPDGGVAPAQAGDGVAIDKKKLDEAKKFIIAEFHKRYT